MDLLATDPTGKIVRPDGTDVSSRDRSDDGAIILRRGLEAGHNYKFGNWPMMPWKFCQCPKCNGTGEIVMENSRDCDLCYASGETMVWKAKAWLKEHNESG